MVSHVMHACKNAEAIKAVIPSLEANHGWPYPDKIPLNKEAGGHEDNGCPYCGMSLDDPSMEPVPAAQVAALNVNQRGGQFLRGQVTMTKGDRSMVAQENAALQKRISGLESKIDQLLKQNKEGSA